MKNKLLLVATIILIALSSPVSASALSTKDRTFFSQNNILFYDPNSNCTKSGSGSGMNISVCDIDLPQEAISRLEAAKVKEKAEQNMERYLYAEEQTGIPWQVLATLHYREANMGSQYSIHNGQKLTEDGSCYDGVDDNDVMICGDPNKDAKEAAEHLIGMVNWVYPEVNILDNPTAEDWGKAFLAYNRGKMYACKNRTYLESPYVMNYYDNDHMAMKWLHEDSYKCDGSWARNHVEGNTDSNVGALAVLAYLCGGSETSSTSSTSSSSSSSSLTSTGGKGCASYEGDYPQYYQGDPRWGSMSIGGISSLSKAGCGPSSLAMLVTYATGQDVFPPDIAELTKDSSYNICGEGRVANTTKVCEVYGCETKKIESTEEAMRQALQEGWMLHYSGKAPNSENRATNAFSPNGHYIGIFYIDDNDNVFIADSSNGNRMMALKDAIRGRHFSIMAIRGKNSGGNRCGVNYCPSRATATAVGEAASIEKDARMAWLFPEGTPTNESDMKQYLEDIEVPIINESGNETTMRLTVHKKLATEIKAVFQDLLQVKNFRIKASDSGGYNWRLMASGSGSLSHHSYGVAIDINSLDNKAAYTKGIYNPGGNYYSVTDEVVEIWKEHGFYWGGNWKGDSHDPMHFTYTGH